MLKHHPNIIAITGKAGAGKDTIRAILEREFAYKGYAFADPIRDMVKTLFETCGIPMQYMLERSLKEAPIPGIEVSYRQMMQRLGTEWGRGLHGDLWIDLLRNRIQADWADSYVPMHIVISDLRFLNEEQMLRGMGAQIWKVERPNLEAVAPHESERQIDQIRPSWTIYNSGSIKDLANTVRERMISQP